MTIFLKPKTLISSTLRESNFSRTIQEMKAIRQFHEMFRENNTILPRPEPLRPHVLLTLENHETHTRGTMVPCPGTTYP
jgi:hypothetical protein